MEGYLAAVEGTPRAIVGRHAFSGSELRLRVPLVRARVELGTPAAAATYPYRASVQLGRATGSRTAIKKESEDLAGY